MKYKHFILLILTTITIYSCKTDLDRKEKQTTDKETKIDDKIENANNDIEIKKSFVNGVNASNYDGDILNIITNNKDSLGFIISKATQGIVFIDPTFFQNWKTSKEKGFVRGAYHFYRCKDDPIQQSKHYLSTISDIELTDLPPIVVFEGMSINDTQSIIEIQNNLFRFIKNIEQKLNRKPIIRTNIVIGNKYLNNPVFADYDLWIDDYTKKSNPGLPELWKTKGWTFWSKSDRLRINHIIEDSDFFNGNMNDLKEFIKNNN
mgnify:CR=1 FL=1